MRNEKDRVHGQLFGHMAIENNEKWNTMYLERAVTMQPTYVAVLSREDFFKVVKRRHDEYTRRRAAFILKVPFLSRLLPNLAYQIAVRQIEETYARNKQVFAQGDVPQKVYLVLSGEFEIRREGKGQ